MRPKVTKFSSGAALMDYQKHIRSSFARTKEEIRLSTAFAYGDFRISTGIYRTQQCCLATQTKLRNSADRSHRIPVFFSPCSHRAANKSSAGSGLENGDERHFRSLARYLFKSGEKPQAFP
jgi:hypothetical protein